ncbi:MAG: GntR family transcriptional regulator [Rhodospirillales bacterium]|nr:GntR family transcriptional regulator [Rhodospirillales bacterium]
MSADLAVTPIDTGLSLKDKIYDSLKEAITSMNIYADDAELRLDERRLSEQLSISRTPVREALARLEQEKLVQIVPRRGVYIVRKTKVEILEMLTVWAALESMSARLITLNATNDAIASLRSLLTSYSEGQVDDHIDEYSENNINFHQAILRMSGNQLICDTADNLFIHIRSIRARTIGEEDRAQRSIVDHMQIVEAIEARDPDLAERLVREHTLNLAKHVDTHVGYLD